MNTVIAALLVLTSSLASADVYIGTAFHIRQFVQHPDQWTGVRAHATGYYFHPNSGNSPSELKGDQQIQITRLFANQRVITERNNGSAPDGDRQQYEWMDRLGMTPVGGLVAEVNRLAPFEQRVTNSSFVDTAGRRQTVPLYADQRPWTSEWNQTADIPANQIDAFASGNAGLTQRLKIMTAGAGFALETDLTRSMQNGTVDPSLKHFKICLNMLRYARLHGKKTLLFLHGFEDNDLDHYVENNMQFVRALEAADAYPDGFIDSFYSFKSPLPMVPETTTRGDQRSASESVAGLAWALLAREGAIELPAPQRPHATATVMSSHDNVVELSIRVENPDRQLDFAPALLLKGSGSRMEYAFGDRSLKPLAGNELRLVGDHALKSDSTQIVHLKISPDSTAAETTQPAGWSIRFRQHYAATSSPSLVVYQQP